MTTKVPAKKTVASLIYDSGGRRFMLCLLALASAHWLAWFGRISGESYAIAVGATVGAFIAGISYQKVKGTDP